MARIATSQAATARPETAKINGLATTWTAIFEAPDYSVPDTTRRWPNARDPADDDRRIQPGQALILTPIYVRNISAQSQWVDVRLTDEDGTSAEMVRVTVPAGDTYSHPIAGITLTKSQIGTSQGDRLEMRAENAGVLHVTGTVAIGAAEQDQPE